MGKGPCEVLPLRKGGGGGGVLAMLKGGSPNVLGLLLCGSLKLELYRREGAKSFHSLKGGGGSVISFTLSIQNIMAVLNAPYGMARDMDSSV